MASARVSRRKLAEYVADTLIAGTPPASILQKVAAYLVDTGRTRELELVVRDIEAALAERGIVVADVVSASPLSEALTKEIAGLIGAKDIRFRTVIDKTVLGGVRLDIPGKRFDGTIRRKLEALKARAW